LGRGALGFEPILHEDQIDIEQGLDALYEEAIRLTNGVEVRLSRNEEFAMATVGGARPKAYVVLGPESESDPVIHTHRGWAPLGKGEVPYLLKFDCTGSAPDYDHETRFEAA